MMGYRFVYFQLEEDNTEGGSHPAVKRDGFKVPPPPGYKPKPQTDTSTVPAKKGRGRHTNINHSNYHVNFMFI